MRKIRDYAVGAHRRQARASPTRRSCRRSSTPATTDGSSLTDDELIAFFALLFPAGAETTRSALAGAVHAFAQWPRELDRLSR